MARPFFLGLTPAPRWGQRAQVPHARSLIKTGLDPLVTISPDGKVTDVNETTAKVTGTLDAAADIPMVPCDRPRGHFSRARGRLTDAVCNHPIR